MLVSDDGRRPLRDIDAIEVPVGTLRYLLSLVEHADTRAIVADSLVDRALGDDRDSEERLVDARVAALCAADSARTAASVLRKTLGESDA